MVDFDILRARSQSYWVAVYLRWQDDAGWSFLKKTMFGKLPLIPKLFVPNLVRKSMLKQLHAQGMGRHTLDEVLYIGVKTLDSLVVILGNKKYFFGEKPTQLDATACAFLVNILWLPMHDPFKQHALKYKKYY